MVTKCFEVILTLYLTFNSEVNIENRGSFTKEIYWVESLQITWASANTFCRDFNLDLVTLADKAEETSFLNLIEYSDMEEMSYTRSFIGATILDSTNWYWIQSGQNIGYAINWFQGEPNNGGDSGIEERCMAVGNNGGNSFAMFDATCYHQRHPFMCQRLVRR